MHPSNDVCGLPFCRTVSACRSTPHLVSHEAASAMVLMWLQKRRLTLVGETVGMTRLPKATEKAEPHRTEREFALLRDDRADSVFDTLIKALEEMPEALSAGILRAISSATSSAPAIQASHRRKLWRRWRCSAPGRSRYESSCRTSADQRQRPDSTRQLRSKPRLAACS